MNVVAFAENTEVFGDSYAKEIAVAPTKTAKFNKIVDGGKVTLTDDSTAEFKEGATLLSTLESNANLAVANFAGNTIIRNGVGTSAHPFAKISFTNTDDKKSQFVAGDLYATDIDLKNTNLFAIDDVIIHGKITSVGTHYNSGLNNIVLTDGVAGTPSTFSGALQFTTSYDGNINGYFIVDGANTVADFAGATSVKLFLDDQSKARVTDGTEVKIFIESNGGKLSKLDLAKVDGKSTPRNGFTEWVYDTDKGVFTGKDISGPAGKAILDAKGASIRGRENYLALNNRNNTLDAKGYSDELYNLGQNAATQGDFVKSVDQFNNPSTAQASQAITEAVNEAGSIITSRMQTLANPEALKLTSASDEGIAAGEQDSARYGVWGSPFYNQGIQKMRKGVSGYRSKTYGGTVGFDTMANDTMIVGLAATVVKTDIKHKNINAGDKTKANTVMFSIYGLQQINEDWFLQGVANFGSTKVKNSAGRTGFNEGAVDRQTAYAKYDSMSWGGEVMAGYSWKMSDLAALAPMIGIDYTRTSDSGYTETGTRNQNQVVSKKSIDNIKGIVGIRGVMASTDYSGVTITPEAHAFVRQSLGNKKAKMNISLNGLATKLSTLEIKPAKTFVNVGAGLNAQSGMYDYGITYDAHLANKYVGHQGTLKVRVNF
jgi:outer membrane autotransporter protein